MSKQKETTFRFFVNTESGAIPLEDATEEQRKAQGKKILQSMGRVITDA